jgi:hypothetical protein
MLGCIGEGLTQRRKGRKEWWAGRAAMSGRGFLRSLRLGDHFFPEMDDLQSCSAKTERNAGKFIAENLVQAR